MTLDDYIRTECNGNEQVAALRLQCPLSNLRRWHRRETYAPESSAWRIILTGKDVELPRRSDAGEKRVA